MYALLMSAVLSLLLSFYTHRLQASYKVYREQTLSHQASLLAEFAKTLATDKEGEILFDQGRVAYGYRGDKLEMTVTSGYKVYHYTFLKKVPSEIDENEEPEDNKKSDKTQEEKSKETLEKERENRHSESSEDKKSAAP